MHVMLVSEVYPPQGGWGGIATYSYHLARALVGLGHRVTVLSAYTDSPAEYSEDGITVLRFIPSRLSSSTERSKEIAKLVSQEVRTRGVDVAEFPEYCGAGAEFQTANPSFPVVVRLHGDSKLCLLADSSGLRYLARRFSLSGDVRQTARLEELSVRSGHVVVSPSEWFADEACRRWKLKRRPRVIANPVPPPAPQGSKDFANNRVLLLGRLCALKGADMFPQIIARVLDGFPAANFHIVGQDCGRRRNQSWQDYIMESVPRLARDRIVFAGGLPHQHTLQVIQQHSIAVFASRVETFSYTIAECMTAGVACVVASQGGAQELGRHGFDILKPSRRSSEIASAVIGLLANPQQRRQMGLRAQQSSRALKAETIAQRMVAVYADAIRTASTCRA